jgi:hypothetical protein
MQIIPPLSASFLSIGDEIEIIFVLLQVHCVCCPSRRDERVTRKRCGAGHYGKVDSINYLKGFQTAKSWKNFIGTNPGGS